MKDKPLEAQVNARVPIGLRTAVRTVAAMTGFSMEEILTDSLCEFLGLADDLTAARRKRSREAFRRLYEKASTLADLEE